jgi:hypothetical protein
MGNSSDKALVFSSNVSLSHHALAQCISSVFLNGQNFAVWSRSLRLGGNGKSGWLLGTEKQPAVIDLKRTQWDMDNYTILVGCLILWMSVFTTRLCITIPSMDYGLLYVRCMPTPVMMLTSLSYIRRSLMYLMWPWAYQWWTILGTYSLVGKSWHNMSPSVIFQQKLLLLCPRDFILICENLRRSIWCYYCQMNQTTCILPQQ